MTNHVDSLVDDELRRCLVVSVIFHVCAVCLLYFGLPSLFKPPPGMLHPLVPIDIVDIGEITNTRIRDDKSEEETKPPAPQPKPAPAAETPPAPTPTPPQPKNEATAESISPPKPMQKPKPPEPPKPEAKQQQDQLSSLLKNVAKMKDAPKNDSQAQSDSKDTASSSGKGLALGDRLTISEEDALRRQISQCWNMPVGAREAENLIVEVLIDVNPDRTVRSARIVDQMRMASDSYFRAAAESALRALRHPKCSPLELNPDKYEQWKTIRFNFDPRDMI